MFSVYFKSCKELGSIEVCEVSCVSYDEALHKFGFLISNVAAKLGFTKEVKIVDDSTSSSNKIVHQWIDGEIQ